MKFFSHLPVIQPLSDKTKNHEITQQDPAGWLVGQRPGICNLKGWYADGKDATGYRHIYTPATRATQENHFLAYREIMESGACQKNKRLPDKRKPYPGRRPVGIPHL